MLEHIAEPHGMDEMREEWKQPASEVYALLEQLNEGIAPENWPQRFYEMGVGNFGERWPFTRRLGVYGASLEIGVRSSTLSKSFYIDGREKIMTKKLQVPFGRRDFLKSSEITEIFELLARIAFAFDWDYAAARCVQEAVKQGNQLTIVQTMDWPRYKNAREAWDALKKVA